MGAVAHRSRGPSVSDATMPCATLVSALCRMARARCPDLVFSSIALTKNTQSPLHVDALNIGDSAIFGFGEFRGGALWVLGSGATRVGSGPLRFDGTLPHCTLSFEGTRYTVRAGAE
mgnify:CR=1 FL=1